MQLAVFYPFLLLLLWCLCHQSIDQHKWELLHFFTIVIQEDIISCHITASASTIYHADLGLSINQDFQNIQKALDYKEQLSDIIAIAQILFAYPHLEGFKKQKLSKTLTDCLFYNIYWVAKHKLYCKQYKNTLICSV